MRKAFVFLLLASVTAPAFAAPGPDDRRDRRSERAQRADDGDDNKPHRRERPPGVERSDDDGDRRAARELRRVRRSGDRDGPPPAPPPPVVVQQSDAPASLRSRRSRERFRENSPGAIQEGSRNGAQVLRDRLARGDGPRISRTPRAGTQPPPRSGSRWRDSNHRWRGDWRSDRRYDWNNHRRRYRHLFHLGYYRDPFGWGYQPF